VSTAAPMPVPDVRGREFLTALRRLWWVPPILGILWVIVTLIVFRCDLRSVDAVAILVGVVVLVAGPTELLTAGAVRGGWRRFRAVFAVEPIVGGVGSSTGPGDTLFAFAEIVGWLLLITGPFDTVLALFEPATGAVVDPLGVGARRVRAGLPGLRRPGHAGTFRADLHRVSAALTGSVATCVCRAPG
jgi:uncharacterized membrane protein HdeD (DUF308 family)